MRTSHLLTHIAALVALGCGSKSGSSAASDPAVALSIGRNEFSCAVLASGAVRCWGVNGEGQLGNPANLGGVSFVPLVAGVSAPAKLVVGGNHACAVLASGAVSCWGYGFHGQLGNGAFGDSVTPVTVTSLAAPLDLAAGGDHNCAVVSGGSVKCWGDNQFGQLGDPDLATSPGFAEPVNVPSISGVQAITAGVGQSCALLADATVKCWGGPMNGGPPYDPVAITSLAGVRSFTSGTLHNCALVADGKVKCWGRNQHGQLGNGTVGPDSPTEAVFVAGIDSATAVGAGAFHSCAVLSGGTVTCWGLNASGQLGDGTDTLRSTPVGVTGLTGAIAVHGGHDHTCALVSGGTVKCWGENQLGQLGLDPTVAHTSYVPVTVGF